MSITFRGTFTALVTPFRSDLSLDEEAYCGLIEHQIAEGIDGIVPCGTTGEASTMSADEQGRVVELAVKTARGRVPVVAGAGGSDTRAVAELAAQAVSVGASAILTASPPYNKPTPNGLMAHYEAVAKAAAGKPVVLYNVPGRTAANMPPEVVHRLASIRGVAALKEASGDINQVESLLMNRPAGLAILSGDDSLTLPLIALGVDGVISVVANEAPRAFSSLVRKALTGDMAGARAEHMRLAQLMRLNFVESNPIPVKTALAIMGLIPEAHFRLPLTPMSDLDRDILAAELRRLGMQGTA